MANEAEEANKAYDVEADEAGWWSQKDGCGR